MTHALKKPKLPTMLRFDFIKYTNKATIRTFNKTVYDIKSALLVQNTSTKELKRLNEIYYDIRTVRDSDGNIIAKRKNPNSELCLVQLKGK